MAPGVGAARPLILVSGGLSSCALSASFRMTVAVYQLVTLNLLITLQHQPVIHDNIGLTKS